MQQADQVVMVTIKGFMSFILMELKSILNYTKRGRGKLPHIGLLGPCFVGAKQGLFFFLVLHLHRLKTVGSESERERH